MMKKIVSVCAAIACMASMAACGQKKEPVAQQEDTPVETATATTAETEAVTEATTEATTEPTTLPEKEEDKKKKELINSFAPDGNGNFEPLSDGEVPDKYSIKVNNEILSASHPVTFERLQRAGWLTLSKVRFFDTDNSSLQRKEEHELFGLDGVNFMNELAASGEKKLKDYLDNEYEFMPADWSEYQGGADRIHLYKYNRNSTEPECSILCIKSLKNRDDIPKDNAAEREFVTSKVLMQHIISRGYYFEFKDDLSDSEKEEISDTYEYYGGLRFFKSTREDVHKVLGDKYVDGITSQGSFDAHLTENDEIFFDDIDELPTDNHSVGERQSCKANYRFVQVHYDENGTLAGLRIVVPEAYAFENADLS